MMQGKLARRVGLDVIRTERGVQTVVLDDEAKPHAHSILQTVFENGEMVKEWRFDEVRNCTVE